RHTRFSRDWSSDVCSSDLRDAVAPQRRRRDRLGENAERLAHGGRRLPAAPVVVPGLAACGSQGGALALEYLGGLLQHRGGVFRVQILQPKLRELRRELGDQPLEL